MVDNFICINRLNHLADETRFSVVMFPKIDRWKVENVGNGKFELNIFYDASVTPRLESLIISNFEREKFEKAWYDYLEVRGY